jgi:steroid 5-alpha reductase family enzyme
MERAERTAIIGTVVALALGAAIALAGSDNGEEVGGLKVFALCAILSYGINAVAFVIAYIRQTEHFFDLTGSLTYLTLVVVALILGPTDWRAVLLAILIGIWATRLGTFLFRRIRRDGGDGRFDDLKPSFPRFLMTWMIQGLWVLLTMACAMAAMTTADPQGFNGLAIVGGAVWVAGFTIEVVSDSQKSAFRAEPENQGKFIDVGLWAWSRHPNYFGEITLWVGIALIALPALDGWQYVTLISPVFVYILLTRISGIPLLESRGKKRWGDDPAYQAYKKRTPVLMLRPPRAG